MKKVLFIAAVLFIGQNGFSQNLTITNHTSCDMQGKFDSHDGAYTAPCGITSDMFPIPASSSWTIDPTWNLWGSAPWPPITGTFTWDESHLLQMFNGTWHTLFGANVGSTASCVGIGSATYTVPLGCVATGNVTWTIVGPDAQIDIY